MSASESNPTPFTPNTSNPESSHPPKNSNAGVAGYYNTIATTEHARLISNRVEFEISLRTILAHLPKCEGGRGLKIVDIGGGTGRYAVSLAQLGHKLTLLDVSRAELDLAAQHAAEKGVVLDGIYQADAAALFETCPVMREGVGRFDAVLMLGPLYHLLDEDERVGALRDAATLLKPGAESGGVLFASFVTTFGHLRGVAGKDPGRLGREKEWYGRYLGLDGVGEDGKGEEKQKEKGRYTRRKDEGVVSYHVHPSEIRELFAKVEGPHQKYLAQKTCGEVEEKGRGVNDCGNLGLQVQKIVACEGFLGAELAGRLNGLGEEEWKVWMDVLERFAGDESVSGASEHLLAVVRVVGLSEDQDENVSDGSKRSKRM